MLMLFVDGNDDGVWLSLICHNLFRDEHNAAFAMHKFAYYQCFKCGKPYYGGDYQCAEAGGGDQFDPSELLCGACSPILSQVSCMDRWMLLAIDLDEKKMETETFSSTAVLSKAWQRIFRVQVSILLLHCCLVLLR